MFQMMIATKILNKIWENWIQEHTKSYTSWPNETLSWATTLYIFILVKAIHHINKKQGENNMIITSDVEQRLWHNSISFYDKKKFNKPEIERSFLNIMKPIHRWQRNRTGRPLSPPQIHQKTIWTPSKFHRTTSECWQRTSGIQKGSLLSSKGGRTKYKR